MALINPESLIEYLNSLLLLDSTAISKLIDVRIQTNSRLAKHETVQVVQSNTGEYTVGLLGILNGLCGIDEDGLGFIVAECDMNNHIEKFLHKKDMK